MVETTHLDALRQFLDEQVRQDRPERFWDATPVFRRLLHSPALTAFLNDQLERLATGFATVSSTRVGAGERCLLLRTNGCGLAMHIIRAEPRPARLYGMTVHRLVGHLSGPPVLIHRYEQTRPEPHDVLAPARTLAAPKASRLGPGHVFAQQAARDVVAVSAPDGPAVLVILESPPVVPFIWEYDAATLAPVRLIAGSLTASRLEYLALMLGRMGHRASIPQLSRLATHHNYGVRWAAIQAIAALDGSTGLDLVHGALDDPHPQIRAAARRTLDLVPQR